MKMSYKHTNTTEGCINCLHITKSSGFRLKCNKHKQFNNLISFPFKKEKKCFIKKPTKIEKLIEFIFFWR